jgi:chromosomal replication initiator protein
MSAESYRNWLEPVKFGRFGDDRILHLLAPNSHVQGWLESEFNDRILAAAQSLGLNVSSVTVGIVEPEATPSQQSFDFGSKHEQFKPEYTFERFVVGSCNEFAHAASRAVANKPAASYNPLFVYSSSGMGKTHLLNAIGHQVQRSDPYMRIVLTTAEDFLNDMVKSIRFNNMQRFHQRFRMADALLVDDVHILGTKERTQEEFFHTFNALYHRGKQIVLTSDSDPAAIPGLVGRLRSRFSCGLMADIQPPDLETKMAILDRNAEEAGTLLPEDVRTYVATRVNSNIRELEGVVNQITARSRFVNGRITLGMVKNMLAALPPVPTLGPSINLIQKEVAQRFDLTVSDLTARNNSRDISHPRQIAMYLCKKLTNSSLSEIGRAFKKHHTTVMHGIAKITRNTVTDKELMATVNALEEKVKVSSNSRF